MEPREITLHGNRVSYRTAGDGPEVIVLVHGITGSSETWAEVIPALGEEFTVVAPDLLGHGQSAKPRGDYSLGAYASGVRDLVASLGHDHATVVGHSLGGGVAMQLAYQFPERCDRLVLVSSGGVRRGGHPPLRAAAPPASGVVAPPGRRLGVLGGAGPSPPRSDPAGFVAVLVDFVEHPAPAEVDEDRWRELLRGGAPA